MTYWPYSNAAVSLYGRLPKSWIAPQIKQILQSVPGLYVELLVNNGIKRAAGSTNM